MRKISSALSILIVILISSQSVLAGVGGPVSPDEFKASDRDVNSAHIMKVLSHDVIASRLSEMGFSDKEIRAQLSLLSDEELAEFSRELQSIECGGFGVWEILVILLIVYLIIKISEMSTLHRNL